MVDYSRMDELSGRSSSFPRGACTLCPNLNKITYLLSLTLLSSQITLSNIVLLFFKVFLTVLFVYISM